MEEATESTVLGDFAGATFEHAGVVSTFSRRDGKYLVRTDGPDGALHDYEIAYTFGVDPLQQYLIAFPGGRYQSLGIAWDSRAKEAGGQRWFHLYPENTPRAGDPLHWTGIDQTWNHMCAECHSTDLRKGYRADEARYETTWAEIDVACEACHGPGSEHVAWARAPRLQRDAARSDSSVDAGAPRGGGATLGLVVRLQDRALDGWQMNPETGTVRRTAPPPSGLELETCARCHSRRGRLVERYTNGRPLLDTHRPALLDQGLYFADGQIRDEVYEYGSFLESRMHAAGVTCSDCHDPHSLDLLASGDALCARCHAPERFAVESHHHHRPDSAGARCAECHMPERTYMVIDRRRDHSLRLPRPDLAAVTGAPDACTACHRDRNAAWAARAIESWGGANARPPHWGEIVAAGWRGELGARSRLAEAALGDAFPPIARATALSLLDGSAPANRSALERGLGDADGLVRLGALRAFENAAIDERLALLPPLLRDPALAVRIDAARLLAAAKPPELAAGDLAARDAALAEYRESQAIDADRPEAHLNLGNLALAQEDLATAEREYREAIRVDPTFTPAHVNLADVLRVAGRDQEGEATLRVALTHHPEDAAIHHALGLTLVRLGRQTESVAELERAAALAPDQPRYAYVLAIALHSTGKTGEAVALLERAHRRTPTAPDLLAALASLERERGRNQSALAWARQLAALDPDDAAARALVTELENAE
jgi:tetratricopeptide (TPR) repeat protein